MRRHVEPNDGGGVRHRVEPCGVMCMRRHLVLTVHTGSGAGHDIRTVLRISPPAGKSAVIPYHGDGTCAHEQESTCAVSLMRGLEAAAWLRLSATKPPAPLSLWLVWGGTHCAADHAAAQGWP
jgi:hypothetical protein